MRRDRKILALPGATAQPNFIGAGDGKQPAQIPCLFMFLQRLHRWSRTRTILLGQNSFPHKRQCIGLLLHLQAVKAPVEASWPGQQLSMGSLLGHSAIFEHEDAIGATDS